MTLSCEPDIWPSSSWRCRTLGGAAGAHERAHRAEHRALPEGCGGERRGLVLGVHDRLARRRRRRPAPGWTADSAAAASDWATCRSTAALLASSALSSMSFFSRSMSPSVLVTNPASRPTSAAEAAACCWLSWICWSDGLSGGGGTAPAGTATPMIRATASSPLIADQSGREQPREAGRPPAAGWARRAAPMGADRDASTWRGAGSGRALVAPPPRCSRGLAGSAVCCDNRANDLDVRLSRRHARRTMPLYSPY